MERRQIGTPQHSSKISHGDSDDQDDGDESRATDDDDDAFCSRRREDEEDERDADDEEMDAEYDEHGMSDWRQGCKNEEYKNEERE